MAFPRKKKPTETPRDRQRLRPGVESGPRATTFSYYASRQPDVANEQRPVRRQRRSFPPAGRLGAIRPRLGVLPFAVLLIVAAVVLGRLLYLSDSPKVVVIASSAAANHNIGSTALYARAAADALKGSALNRCKLTVDSDGISRKLLGQFPELEAVSVSSQFLSSSPVIQVVPAQPKLILQSGGVSYAINNDGVAYGTNPAVQKNAVTVIDQSGLKPAVGKQALPGSTVLFVQTVAYQMQQGGQTVASMTLPAASAYELDLRLAGKAYYVRFNLEADARQQSGALLATIQHLGKASPGYIDVRVPGRVYYK